MLTRELKITGAYSLRAKYGQHGMDLCFYVKGEKGGISIRCFTSWCVPENAENNFIIYRQYPFGYKTYLMAPQIIDVSYHAKTPQYEGQTSTKHCNITDGDCYCDGSSLWGEEWLTGFIHGGSDWLFQKMEDYYNNVFENGPPVNLTPEPMKEPQ
jgi:hypothetical protein